MKLASLLAALSLSLAAPALAQGMDHSTMHGDHGATHSAAPSDDPVAEAYEDANRRMHEAMAIELSGDPDVDFVRSMIAHHVGAIEMAEVVLEHGKDPEIRALAEEIVGAQEAEIDQMRQWLAENGHAED